MDDWATGRIDVSGDVPEYTEIGLPMMKAEDWNNFTRWLEGDFYARKNDNIDRFMTETLWTLDQLVEEYERTNPKITWWMDQ